MPAIRGIKIDIISQWDLRVHPEFPHPDSFKSEAFNNSEDGQQSFNGSPSSTSKYNFTEQEDSVSVYTPSVPGAKFWITWLITEAAVAESQWYYFKLFLNGRHVTSWGTDCHKKPKGQVMRGLFEPSDRWNYKNAGIVYKNMGTESRPFMFAQNTDTGSPATDGGVIEVRVFRALGRRRKMPEPTDYKGQEQYGIVGGLLDKPEDAKFYDWHLKDAKDEPFAMLKFHYRSWNSLYDLSLIPEDHPRGLLSPTYSIRSVLGLADRSLSVDEQQSSDDAEDEFYLETEEEGQFDNTWEEDTEPPMPISEQVAHGFYNLNASQTPWLTSVFDADDSGDIEDQQRRSNAGMQYDDASIAPDPPKIDLKFRFSAFTTDQSSNNNAVRQLKRAKRLSILDRPLPEIPQRTSSIRTSHSRISSGTSVANSITPSLRSYIDRGEISSPDPIVSTAQEVHLRGTVDHVSNARVVDVTPPQSKLETPKSEPSPPLTSPDDSVVGALFKSHPAVRPTQATPPTPKASGEQNEKLLDKSPLSDLFKSPHGMNITVRKHKRNPANILARLSISGSPFRGHSPFRSTSYAKSVESERSTLLLDTTMTPPAASENTIMDTILTEGEWICQTPSPHKDKSRFENMWSPSLGDGGKQRIRRGTESLSEKALWRDSPTVEFRRPNESTVKVSSHKTQRAASTSRERMSMKAVEWYESVRAPKGDAGAGLGRGHGDTHSHESKLRQGWI